MDEIWRFLQRILLSESMLMTVAVVPFIAALEIVRPARAAPLRHYLFGVSYWLANLVLTLLVVMPVLATLLAMGIRALGLGLIDLRFLGFSGLLGALFALLVSTFITDFFFYWFHRALHANRYLWQTHLLHHTDEHMNTLTAHRGHFTETLLSPLFIALPMAALFDLPPPTIGALSVLPFAYLFFVHANLDIGFGRLWWLLVSPNYHRIHHSIEPRHRDRNFANWFPAWDMLFGTAYRPAPGELPATGVDGVSVRTLRDAFALPFSGWYAMLRSAMARPDPDRTGGPPSP